MDELLFPHNDTRFVWGMCSDIADFDWTLEDTQDSDDLMSPSSDPLSTELDQIFTQDTQYVLYHLLPLLCAPQPPGLVLDSLGLTGLLDFRWTEQSRLSCTLPFLTRQPGTDFPLDQLLSLTYKTSQWPKETLWHRGSSTPNPTSLAQVHQMQGLWVQTLHLAW